MKVEQLMAEVAARSPGEPEFHQAVHEVATSVLPVVDATPVYRQLKIMERLVEPERVIDETSTWL